MMRPLFFTAALIFSSLLTGCGFTPMHSATGSASPLSNINVELQRGPSVVDNQAGFFMAQRLRDRIGGQTEAAPYTLKITPVYYRSSLGLTNADIASRYDITVVATWVLVEAKTGNTLENGRSTSVVSFGAPAGPYGVITADNVGVEQSAKETADKLVVQLAKYFAAENKKAKK